MNTSEKPTSVLPAGTPAPDFTLPAGPDKKVSLSDFRGQPVVLVFYPADWSPVCGDQVALYNEILPEFQNFNAQILGISVDSLWSHKAFSEQKHLQFPLLADFEPKGQIARQYGAYRQNDGITERALFVIDEQGTIRWSYVSHPAINPGADGILAALAEVSGQQAAEGQLIVPANEHDYTQGPATAPVTLVEYGDYECPDCGDAYPVVKEVQKRLGDKVRFVYRNFPLTHQHPHAQHAAEVAEAAGDQGKFWEMHDLLYEQQHNLEDEQLLQYADQLGLDREKIRQALENHTYTARIQEEVSSGSRSGVNGTPTFFINGQRHDQAYDVDTLLAALNKAIDVKNAR
ncbi:hypothetical protein KDA_59670 [Dictyobacter alpinus]|uniref:Thioredoxin domain-containing protein n=1 Tax=Dictyobacter alpinus TaxID=2014873 RepID=A0A402BGJ3_9CHLR|nr:redoxin domain-containing protein [Dictyobacter alpinus]GCE30483.1 hypothetical protein KDA_59670 [Dictyobacter alpinus]